MYMCFSALFVTISSWEFLCGPLHNLDNHDFFTRDYVLLNGISGFWWINEDSVALNSPDILFYSDSYQ